MLTVLLAITIIAQSQYWEQTIVGLAPACINEIVVKDARNDGVMRVYGACDNGHLYEWQFIQGGWQVTELPTPNQGAAVSVDAGVGRNDGVVRLYAAYAAGGIYELTYNGSWEITAHVGVGDVVQICHLAAASGLRPDGLVKIYAGDYKYQYEFAFVGGSWTRSTIGSCPGAYPGTWDLIAATGRNDGQMRLYLASSDLWEITFLSPDWVYEKINCFSYPEGFLDVAVGCGRNDGRARLYSTDYWAIDAPPGPTCEERTWDGSQWQCRYLWRSYQIGQPHGLDICDGRHDGQLRLYLATYFIQNEVYYSRMREFDLVPGHSFACGDFEGMKFRDLTAGIGRNDMATRLYISAEDGHVVEYSYIPTLASNQQHSTAYNEQPHLARMPNTENLLVVYQSSNKVYFSESYDGGVNWNLPQVIGNGIYPAIGVTGFGSPCVTYLSPDGTDLIYKYRDPMMMQWLGFTVFDGNFALRPEQASMFIHSTAGDSVRLAFRVIDLGLESSFIYYADFPWYETNSTSHSQVIDGQPPDYIDRRSPSISADMFDQLHVAWQKAHPITGLGETYYRYRDAFGIWSLDYNVSGSSQPSVYPHCEAYGDSVFVHWSDEYSTQNLDVWRAARYVFHPLWQWTKFQLPSTPDSSVFPVCAVGEYSVWSEKTNNSNFEIYYWNRTTNQINNLSETPNRSWFGHSNIYQSLIWPEPVLYTCWTESLYADAYEVQIKKLGGGLDFGNDPYVCFYSIPVGDSALARYTTRRKGRILWPNRGVWADYDSTALSYRLLCPNPKFLYKVVAVPYQEKSGSWSARFTADGLPIRTVTFNSGTWDTFQFWLPENTYKTDKTVNLRIERATGEYVPIAYLRVYQFEKKNTAKGEGGYAQGGAQSAETQSVQLKTELNGIAPNPLAKATRIHYTLATASRVSLKVCDPTGRLVRNLVDKTMSAGAHACVWQGSDDRGKRLPNGIYFVRMTTPEYKATEKVILLQQ